MVNRVLLGSYGGSFKARISRPGIDVLTATSLSDFMMHEAYAGLAPIQSGVVYLPPGTARTVIYVAQEGYRGQIRVYTQTTNPSGINISPGGMLEIGSNYIAVPANTTSYTDVINYWVLPSVLQ